MKPAARGGVVMSETDENKRSQKRYSVRDIQVEYTEANLFSFFKRGRPQRKPLVDLSSGGVQILCSERLQVGDKFKLSLFLPKQRNPVEVRAQVRWTQQIPRKSLYRTGLELLDLDAATRNSLDQFEADLGEESIRILCNSCGAGFLAKRKFEGRKIKCPKCAKVIEIVDSAPQDDPGGSGIHVTVHATGKKSPAGKAAGRTEELLKPDLQQFLRQMITSRVHLALLEYVIKGGSRTNVFSPKELSKVLGENEKTLIGVCRDLSEKGILREVGTRTYNFAPGKRVREQISELQRANVQPKQRAAVLSFVMQREG